MYGVNTANVACLANYLNGRKQYTRITEYVDWVKKDIKCGVTQGSILGLLLILFYVNNLPYSSNLLDPIMFTKNTNFWSTDT